MKKLSVSAGLFFASWLMSGNLGQICPGSLPVGMPFTAPSKPDMAGDFERTARKMAENLAEATPKNLECTPAPPAQAAGMTPISNNEGMWLATMAPTMMNLCKHLEIMKDEVVRSENLDLAQRLICGMSFDQFEEDATSRFFSGIPIVDDSKCEGDPLRYPYVHLIESICKKHNLDEKTKSTLLNGNLATDSSVMSCDIRFNVGKPGLFYYGKFMAHTSQGARSISASCSTS